MKNRIEHLLIPVYRTPLFLTKACLTSALCLTNCFFFVIEKQTEKTIIEINHPRADITARHNGDQVSEEIKKNVIRKCSHRQRHDKTKRIKNKEKQENKQENR